MFKKRISILLIALFILLTGCSQDTFVDDPTIEGTVSFLASDELQGRLTGTEGNEKAIEYIVDRFEEIELEPYDGESYFHEYTQTIYNPDKQQNSLVINYKDGSSKECIRGVDYVEQNRVNNLDITYPVTFDDNDEELDDKIIVLDENHEVAGVRNRAKGLLVKSSEFFGNTHVIDGAVPIVRISEELYKELESKEVDSITIKSQYTPEEIIAKNIIGKIKGTDSNKALVLSAHFDHVGWAGETIFYGAVDNASGTAVMLDLAEKLKTHSSENPFNMDIIICGFNGEEYGLKGSSAFVEAIKDQYDEIYNINIDSVGKIDGGRTLIDSISQVDRGFIDELKKSFEKFNLDSINQQFGASDHESFTDNNICGINIASENLFSGNRIHSEKDSIENIDFNCLEKVSDAIYDFIVNNDGTIFKLDTYSENNGEEELSDEEWLEINRISREMIKEENLKYDEIIAFEFKDSIIQISGNYALTNFEQINEYYSEMIVPEDLLGYGFNYLYINDFDTGIHQYFDKSTYDREIESVYKRELNPKDIIRATINYEKDNLNLAIYIDVPFSTDETYYRLNTCDTEEIDIDGNKHTILRTKGKDSVEGIFREYIFNNKKFLVEIRRFVVIDDDNNVKSYTNTKEEIIDAAKQINIEELIKGLGI